MHQMCNRMCSYEQHSWHGDRDFWNIMAQTTQWLQEGEIEISTVPRWIGYEQKTMGGLWVSHHHVVWGANLKAKVARRTVWLYHVATPTNVVGQLLTLVVWAANTIHISTSPSYISIACSHSHYLLFSRPHQLTIMFTGWRSWQLFYCSWMIFDSS